MKMKCYIVLFAALLFSSFLPVIADDGAALGEWFSSADPALPVKKSPAEDDKDQSSGMIRLRNDSESGDTFSPAAAVVEEGTGNDTERLLFSNFNSDPVKNKPTHYFPLSGNQSTVLITRIRTFHWNDGYGAAPGTVGIYDTSGGERICGGQAVGRSAHGIPNVYWDALTECLLEPGHTYRVKVSDDDSWSFNEASSGAGMFELYGFDPLPEGYTAAPQKTVPSVSAAETISAENSKKSYTVPDSLSAGMFFEMGYTEQNNKPEDGPEPITWQVLAVQKDRALVISKYVLDYRTFTDNSSAVYWENSAIRKWLNDDFYNGVFTAEERNRILLVTNENPANIYYGTWGGPSTQDRIFLLSYDEANRNFRTDRDRMCSLTKTAGSKVNFGASDPDNTVVWALRSPGYAQNTSMLIGTDGAPDYYGIPNYINGTPSLFAVRPAFWMRTKAVLTGFRVTYHGNNCLAKVPTDSKVYQAGDKVTVLFDPVEYMPGLIFNGWDGNGDGVADYGYYYNNFPMPAKNVELKAICYMPQYQEPQYHNDYFDVTITQDRQQPQPDYNLIPDPGGIPGNLDPVWMDGVG